MTKTDFFRRGIAIPAVGLFMLMGCTERDRQSVTQSARDAASRAGETAREGAGEVGRRAEELGQSAEDAARSTTDRLAGREPGEQPAEPGVGTEAGTGTQAQTEPYGGTETRGGAEVGTETSARQVDLADLRQEQVRRIQQALRRNGATIAADGVAGPATEKAIRDFQTREGLESSGNLTMATLERLQLSPREFMQAE